MESKVDKERIGYRRGMSKSYEDPMPEYISPELLMLIAKNAPSELDVFKTSLKHWNKLTVSNGNGTRNGQERRRWTGTAMEADFGVQVRSSSGKERNYIPNQSTLDGQRSCPNMTMWSDYDTEDTLDHSSNNVKRKRPKSTDFRKPCTRRTTSPISVNPPWDERKDAAGEEFSSPQSVDFISGVDQKPAERRPASAPAVSASSYESDALNAKPWRHGMKKKLTPTELKPAETISCKRKAHVDPKKQSEVKKYMETKFSQLRKERKLQKARAEAALSAQKEKQRKLDMECQVLLKSQVADLKTKPKICSRPPWTSEYVTLAETFRPWSRASTGDLPPPKVPRNHDPVPLDLYTSISTYEAARKSILGEDGNTPNFSKSGNQRRSKKLKTREAEGEKQQQRKNTTSDMYEMAFPPTHPYHALHPQAGGTTQKMPPASKARWKSKGKSLKRFDQKKIYHLQSPPKYASGKCVDLMAYRRTLRVSRTPHRRSLSTETRSAHMQKHSNKRSSHNGYTNLLQRDDCYAISALREHERDVWTRSKVKRLKPASAPSGVHISLPQFDHKPKYSRVRPGNRRYVAMDSKQLSLQDITKVMKSRLSPCSSRETVHTTGDFVSPGTIHSQKSSRHVSHSPHKNLMDVAVLQVVKPTRTHVLSPQNSPRKEVKSQLFDSTRQESMSRDKHSTDEDNMQVIGTQKKDTTKVESEISKDVTRAIRRQRMHMLRNLAEQLAKRVDAACAEQQQQLQHTPKTESEPTFEPHADINNEPCNQPVGPSCLLGEPLQVEPKFYYQPEIPYHAHLSELEQAGFPTVELPKQEIMAEMVPSVNDLTDYPLTVDTGELNNFPRSEISPHDWNVTDKGMSMSDNIPSGCSSYGPSSSSTDSSSPQAVILPTGAKYSIRRIKRDKNVEEKARKRQKEEAWALPAEEDIHSVINLYTQHWLSREKKKSRGGRCELTDISQGECEENASSRTPSHTPLHEHAPEKHKFKFGAAPMCNELAISEPCIKSLESNNLTPKVCADSSGIQRELLEGYHRESVPCIMQESTPDIYVAKTPSTLEKSVATIDVKPMKEESMKDDNSEKKNLAGQRKPEGMLVQIGDLRLCQSPTSFHLRLDTHKDDQQLKKPLRDDSAVTSSKMETTATDACSPLVGSSEDCQIQTLKAPFTPMKITYARRVRTRTVPDGVSTGDERIIVEFHQINREGSEQKRQNFIKEVELSGNSTSETSTEKLRLKDVDVQNLDDPDPNRHVQEDVQQSRDGSGTPTKLGLLLQPGTNMTSSDIPMAVFEINGASAKKEIQKMPPNRTAGRSKNNEVDILTSLNSPVKQFEENLDPLSTDATDLIGEKRISRIRNTKEHCEGSLGMIPTKQSDFEEKSIHSKMNTNIARDGDEDCWEKEEDQDRKENNSKNSITPSTYGQREELPSKSKQEVLPDKQQDIKSTQEWQLKSRRDQLEAELQKLDIEIRKTRSQLQTSHSIFDTKIQKSQQSATVTGVVAGRMLNPSFSKYNGSSGGVHSDDLTSGRSSNSLSSSRAEKDSPRQKTSGFSSKVAYSVPMRTLDIKLESPTYSNSFVSEDIQVEEEIFSPRTLEMVPDTVGGRCGNHYELLCRETPFMNDNFKYWEAKGKPISQNEQSAKEVSEEELSHCNIISTQDEVVVEGSENSTGRVPFERFYTISNTETRKVKVPSASTQLKESSSRLLDDHTVNSPYHNLQLASKEENKEGVLSISDVKTYSIPEAGDNFTYKVKNKNGETVSSAPLDRDAGTKLDLSEDALNRCSFATSTQNRKESKHIAGGDNESGSRRSISRRKSDKLADEVHNAVKENSTMNLRDFGRDVQQYVEGAQISLQSENSPIQRNTMITSASEMDMDCTKVFTSSPARKQLQFDTVKEDSPLSLEGGAQSKFLKPKTPEGEEVVEDSPSSSRDGVEGKSKTSEVAVNTRFNLNQLPWEIAETSERVNVLRSNSTGERLQKSKSRACISDANLSSHRTPQQTGEAQKEESFSLDVTNMFSAGETTIVLHDPPTPQVIGGETPWEVGEAVVPQENFEDMTVTRDDLKETFPPNVVEETSTTISLQDNGFPSSESGRMKRLWSLDSEVPHNLTEDPKVESHKKLLQREKTSLGTSEQDKPELVTDLSHPNVNLETLSVPQIRPGTLHELHQEQIPFEVRGSMCFQEGSRCTIPVIEGTITGSASLKVISGSSNQGIEETRNPSTLPPSGLPISHTYALNIVEGPVRSQWSFNDSSCETKTGQIRASTDVDQSTDSPNEVEKQVIKMFAQQQLCPNLTKNLHESPCAGIQDGLHCALQIYEKRAMEHWERLIRLCQENDINHTLGVPTFFPHNAVAPTVQGKSLEVGEVVMNLLELDSSYQNKTSQQIRHLKPIPPMLKNKVDHQDLAKIESDVTESCQYSLPPVLFPKTSKPLEIGASEFSASGEGEYSKPDNSTSRDQQEIDIPCCFGLPHDEKSSLLSYTPNMLREENSKDGISPRYGPECTRELITPTTVEEKTEISCGSPRCLQRQPIRNLFSSLYGKEAGGTFSNSGGSHVSEELENFDSELDGKLESDMGVRLAPVHVKAEQFLEPYLPHLSGVCLNISETSCASGQETFIVAVSTKSPTIYAGNQGEYDLTKRSSEVEVMTKSIILRDSSVEPPVCHAGTGNYKFQDTEDNHADINCESDIDLDKVEQSQKDANLMLTALSVTKMSCVDTNEPTLSSGIDNEFEQSPCSGGCNESPDIVPHSTITMDLGSDIDVTADLGDLADGTKTDEWSKRKFPGELIDSVTSYRPSMTTVTKNDANLQIVSGAVQEKVGVVSNSHIKGGATEDLQVPTPYSIASREAQIPCHKNLGVPNPLLFLQIKPGEHEESLMREILNSKVSGFSPHPGEEDCLNVPRNEVGRLDLGSRSSWSEGKDKSDEHHNISTQIDGRFHRKETLKVTTERLESHKEELVSRPPALDVELTSRMTEPASWLPEEAHRLVECFLSSGSELLDRASQVSKAFSSCSVVNCSPGISPYLECSDQRMVGTHLETSDGEEDMSSFGCLPREILSGSRAARTAEDGERHQVFSYEPDGADVPEPMNPVRPDQIISLRSVNPAHRLNGNSRFDTKPVVLTIQHTRDSTEQDIDSRFTTLLTHNKVHVQQSTAPSSFPSRDLSTHNECSPIPLVYTIPGDMQYELGTKQLCCEQGETLTEIELPEFRDIKDSAAISVPQLASALAISQQIPEVGESRVGGSGSLHYTDSVHHDDESCPSRGKDNVKVDFKDHPMEHLQPNVDEFLQISDVYREGSCVSGEEKTQCISLDRTQEAEIQDNKEQSVYKLPTEDTSTATCHDQDSICSVAGSGESQDLDGTLEDIKLQTSANRARKHNMLADTLTDMLFETLLTESLSDLAIPPSRSITQALSTETNQTSTASKTSKPKIKSRSKKGFTGVLKHFLPTGWRAASVKHKTGLFLQVAGLRPHPLSLPSGKLSSVSETEGLPGMLHNTYPPSRDFDQGSLLHRTTTETVIALLTSKEYVQSYVQKTLELASLLPDPSPLIWDDSRIPVEQDIYARVMETQHSNRFGASDLQGHNNKLLSDLVNESLIKYSSTMHHSPSALSFPVDGGNVLHFVTSRIVEQGTSALTHGSDIDKVVGKLLEDEQWENCYEEARDLVSELAQRILWDLIDRFVKEMIYIQVKNNTSSGLSVSVCRNFFDS